MKVIVKFFKECIHQYELFDKDLRDRYNDGYYIRSDNEK